MGDRKKEVIDICLATFMAKGLSETSVRDLSRALNLQSGGIYTYFDGKDDAVIACAEEAAVRIEHNLIHLAIRDVENPENMINNLFNRSKEMRPLMKFFVSVCSLPKYEQAIHPMLSRLSERYVKYVNEFADILNREPNEVAPYVYMTINTMFSFMVFGQETFAAPQTELTVRVLNKFLETRNSNDR